MSNQLKVVRKANQEGFVLEGSQTFIKYADVTFTEPITRLYTDELVIIDDSVVSVPALAAYLEHLSFIEALLQKESLKLSEAEELYLLLKTLHPKFIALGSGRNSQYGRSKNSLRAKCEKKLGLTSRRYGILGTFDKNTVSPEHVVKFARKELVEEPIHKFGWVLIIRLIIETIDHILNHRSDELNDELSARLQETRSSIKERLLAVEAYGFVEAAQPNERTPYANEVLRVGETVIATCIRWDNNLTGIVEWNGGKCRVTKRQLVFPQRRVPQKKRLFVGELVEVTVVTSKITTVHIHNLAEYLDTNERIQTLIEQSVLDTQSKENLRRLMSKAQTLHQTLLPERCRSLNFKNWHAGLQRAAERKLR